MSGGHFTNNLDDVIVLLQEIIDNNLNEDKDQYGDTIGTFYGMPVMDKIKTALTDARNLQKSIKAIDYLVCGDYSVDTFLSVVSNQISEDQMTSEEYFDGRYNEP